MSEPQSAILEPVPDLARYMSFNTTDRQSVCAVLDSLNDFYKDGEMVIGLGNALIETLGTDLDQLSHAPVMENNGISLPSTKTALWCWLRGDDRGVLYQSSRHLEKQLAQGFQLKKVIDAFRYLDGHDLTGYEDGTENPEGDDAYNAAIFQSQNPALAGSSFVAVQQWVHNMDTFDELPQDDRDNIIGRRLSDNEELEDAPDSAHVKRTAQEDFDPEAFMVRRSMPWTDESRAGLNFVAFGHSFYAFEAQMKRMMGLDDGIMDGLFRFSRPISSSYFWCPPVKDGKLNLSSLAF